VTEEEELRLKVMQRQTAARLKSAAQTGMEPVGTFKDGTIYRAKDGSLSFKSPGYSTNDQNVIAGMMAGMTPAETGQAQIDEQRIAANPVASRALKALEGTPFVGSYADEAVGLASPEAAKNMRAASAAMDRQRPGQSIALNLGGAVATAIPMAIAAGPTLVGNAAKTLGARAVQGIGLGAGLGAVEGAVYGAGKEGDRVGNAAKGAFFGGAAGAVTGGLAPYIGEGVKNAISRLKGSEIGAIQKALGISGPAARTVKAALDAGDPDEAMRALQRAGDNAMLADAGQPAAQLLDAAANTGGAAGRIAKDAVENRVTGASKDVSAALDRYLGKPQGAKSIGAGVRSATAAARSAAYDAAYAKPIDYSGVRGKFLETILKNRVPKAAIDKANALMRAEGASSAQIMASIADDGTVTFQRMPDVRQIDYITRALQDVAQETDGAGALGGKTQLGGSYSRLVSEIRGALKSEVPEYGKALDVASDAISRVKASEFGYTLLRPGTTREAVAEALRGAGAAQKAEMKAGVRSYIDDAMASVTRAMTDQNMDAREAIKVLRETSSRANQQKLRFVLGQKQADALLAEMDKAATAFELRAALATNSKTAIRGSIQESVKRQTAPGALEALSSGEPTVAAKRFVQIFTGNGEEARALREAGIFEEIATALTTQRGLKAQAALKAVNDAMAGKRVTEAQARLIGAVVADSFALSADRQVSRLQSAR